MNDILGRWRFAFLPVLMGMLLLGRLAIKSSSSDWLIVFAVVMLAIGLAIGVVTWRAAKLDNA